jgi:hypothetical protein
VSRALQAKVISDDSRSTLEGTTTGTATAWPRASGATTRAVSCASTTTTSGDVYRAPQPESWREGRGAAAWLRASGATAGAAPRASTATVTTSDDGNLGRRRRDAAILGWILFDWGFWGCGVWGPTAGDGKR